MKQISLFDTRPLIPARILSRYWTEHGTDIVPSIETKLDWLSDWHKEIHSGQKKKETSLEQAFNTGFFCQTLGYTIYPGADDHWSAWPKPPGFHGEPDLILGHFGHGIDPKPLVVVELKKPGTVLDAPQPSYGNLSPVEQAFGYATQRPTCRWVVVSDMRLIRIYSVKSADAFLEFDLDNCCFGESDERIDKRAGYLRQIYSILAKNRLIEGDEDSTVSRLLFASESEQLDVQRGFYKIYSDIRLDLLKEIRHRAPAVEPEVTDKDCILAAQRLLDRIIFIHFCEDHPDRLLPNEVLFRVVSSAVRSPGSSSEKAYEAIKALFRDLDEGANTEFWQIPKYNGELFKFHPIIDRIQLPDSLVNKSYSATSGATVLNVKGAWGLHVFDFWTELDRDLLGNVFERSVADIADMSGDRALLESAIEERKSLGVYYTTSRLAKFMSHSAIRAVTDEDASIQAALAATAKAKDLLQFEIAFETLSKELAKIRIVDLSCGSGAFLTAALDALLSIYRKGLESSLRFGHDITYLAGLSQQSQLLKSSIFGIDLLPQATELAKLSLWLSAARLQEPAADLSENLISADSLQGDLLTADRAGIFDVVVGNPPWGSKFDAPAVGWLGDLLGEDVSELDSWEVFLRLAWLHLKPSGRLSLVLPDTFFSSAKESSRRFVLERFRIEKCYSMGPGWFGPEVRMGTLLLQAKKCEPDEQHKLLGLLLAGPLRKQAIAGNQPLQQIEKAASQEILQARALRTPGSEIRVFCSDFDSELMSKIASNSVALEKVSNRARGEEISAEGLLWGCPSCGGYSVPGAKKKGGGFKDKLCPHCGLSLREEAVKSSYLVSDVDGEGAQEKFVDGKILNHRYQRLSYKWIRTDLSPVSPSLKDPSIYAPPKLLIRQAGVGVTASLDTSNARCPQSVYIYRATEEARGEGYTEEFLLAALVSRTLTWLIFKRFGELDPDRAHAKLTHTRLSDLPIPRLETAEDRAIAKSISALAHKLVSADTVDPATDNKIELALRELWGISPEEGAYINGSFSLVPDSQAVKDLFPTGAPHPFIPNSTDKANG